MNVFPWNTEFFKFHSTQLGEAKTSIAIYLNKELKSGLVIMSWFSAFMSNGAPCDFTVMLENDHENDLGDSLWCFLSIEITLDCCCILFTQPCT